MGQPLHQSSSRQGPEQSVRYERRGFIRATFGSLMGVGLAASAVAGALWTAITTRFLFPNTLKEPPSKFRAGYPEDYPFGHVETKFKEEHGVWVVHGSYKGNPQLYALRTVCTHLGCITIWQPHEQRFKCPCHGSAFYASGINYEGPAPRPLERYAIRIADDGQLEVDKSVVYQEELGQWTDPASYVPGLAAGSKAQNVFRRQIT